MTLQRKILLLGGDPHTAVSVVNALKAAGSQDVQVCANLSEMPDRLNQEPSAVVLVDISADPKAGLSGIEWMIRRFPTVPFLALADELNNEWILAAMRAGAKYFLTKGTLAADLKDALSRLAPTLSVTGAPGVVVTVLSCGGGCGATTLAINLADQLHVISKEEALLVDMDLCYASISQYLGLAATYGLGDVLAHADEIDEQLVRSTMVTHGDGLRVLASPAGPNWPRGNHLDFSQMPRAIDLFRRVSKFTVFDAPRVDMDMAFMLAGQSIATLLVFQLNVKDLRFAQWLLSSLIAKGADATRLWPVASRTGQKHAMVEVADARKLLGMEVTEIRNDYRAAITSVNYGMLLSQTAPRSLLAKGTEAVARRILDLGRQNGKAERIAS